MRIININHRVSIIYIRRTSILLILSRFNSWMFMRCAINNLTILTEKRIDRLKMKKSRYFTIFTDNTPLNETRIIRSHLCPRICKKKTCMNPRRYYVRRQQQRVYSCRNRLSHIRRYKTSCILRDSLRQIEHFRAPLISGTYWRW